MREMDEIRKADPAARRRAALLAVVALAIGALVILLLERYRIPLRDWALADREASLERVRLIILLFAALMLAPLLGLAAYLWSLGTRIRRAGEYPAPGLPVTRDVRVVRGAAAAARARQLRLLAAVCIAAAVVLCLLLWRLASRVGLPSA